MFLKQLKELNSQYKEVTGQMAQVLKEEGLPKWDLGDTGALSPDPAVHIKEMGQELTVSIDLPGIQKETLKVTVHDGKTLLVSADRKVDSEVKKVEKTVELPSAVDATGVKAGYAAGVVTVQLPKTASQEVTIPVQ